MTTTTVEIRTVLAREPGTSMSMFADIAVVGFVFVSRVYVMCECGRVGYF